MATVPHSNSKPVGVSTITSGVSQKILQSKKNLNFNKSGKQKNSSNDTGASVAESKILNASQSKTKLMTTDGKSIGSVICVSSLNLM